MATTTFKIVLKDRPLASGLHAVRIRITHRQKHAYYNTGIRVKPSEFNEVGSERLRNWVKGHRQQGLYNDRLQQQLDALRELALQHPALSAKELKALYEKGEESEPTRGLLAFWQQWIDRKMMLGKAGTAVMYTTVRNALLDFTGPNPDEARLLTPQFAVEYLVHLQEKRGYKSSTCKLAFTALNTVYRHAVEEGWLERGLNPFTTVAVDADIKKRLRPTHAQVMAMMELELMPGSAAWDARNCFLLQYHLHGARVSEALLLEWSSVTDLRVEYRPMKRSKESKSVPMSAGLRWVLQRCDRKNRYVLPYLTAADGKLKGLELLGRLKSGTGSVREGLRQISRLLGLPFDLTSHMARHAFADEALKHVKDLRVLQKLLGHDSIVTTERYVEDLKGDRLDEASAQVYGMRVA